MENFCYYLHQSNYLLLINNGFSSKITCFEKKSKPL